MLQKEQKQDIIQQVQLHEGDTGSSEVQIAILTERIKGLTGHLRTHKHDYHSQRGLMKLIGQRRRLLRYLKRENPQNYAELTNKLNIRR